MKVNINNKQRCMSLTVGRGRRGGHAWPPSAALSGDRLGTDPEQQSAHPGRHPSMWPRRGAVLRSREPGRRRGRCCAGSACQRGAATGPRKKSTRMTQKSENRFRRLCGQWNHGLRKKVLKMRLWVGNYRSLARVVIRG